MPGRMATACSFCKGIITGAGARTAYTRVGGIWIVWVVTTSKIFIYYRVAKATITTCANACPFINKKSRSVKNFSLLIGIGTVLRTVASKI